MRGWGSVSVCVFRRRGLGRLHHSRSNSRQSLVAMTTVERKPPSIYILLGPWRDLEEKIKGLKRKGTIRNHQKVEGKRCKNIMLCFLMGNFGL